MNWIRENKFLSGFIAVVAIGAGVLGYLLWSAYGDFAQVSDQYDQEAAQLQSLQAQVPYPNLQNLKKYQTERDDLIDATHDLATTLARMVLPVKEMSPSDFQDHLRATVSGIVSKAARTGVKLPEHFSMDFDQYETQPPLAGAAAPLGRQLAAIEIAMNILIDAHVDSINSLQRSVLPEESGASRAQRTTGPRFGPRPGGPTGPRGGPGGGAESTNELVEKYPFEIRFDASQSAFQQILDNFAASSGQFFITRALALENSNPKPVAKEIPNIQPMQPLNGVPGVPGVPGAPGMPGAPGVWNPGAAPNPAPEAAGGEGGTGFLKYIVGTEHLAVIMHVDIVAFNPPEKSTRAAGAEGRAPAP